MTPWLPDDFVHPVRVELADGVILRPIRASDVDRDMITVMSNQRILWGVYGEAWGWPPPTMTREQDEEDLARHAREIEAHESFNYAVVPTDETSIHGCVYIDPLEAEHADAERPAAEVSWWTGEEVDPAIRSALDAFVPAWIASAWPFTRVDYPFAGRG